MVEGLYNKKIIKNNKAYQENGVTRSLWGRGSGG